MSNLVSHERFLAMRERRQRSVPELPPPVEPPIEPAVSPDLALPIYCEAVAAEVTPAFGGVAPAPAPGLLFP